MKPLKTSLLMLLTPDSLKPWIKPILIAGAVAIFLVAWIVWMLLPKAKDFDSSSAARVQATVKIQEQVQNSSGQRVSSTGDWRAPDAAPATAPAQAQAPAQGPGAPPPMMGGAPPQGVASSSGAPTARPTADSQRRPRDMAAFMKNRIEGTAPEDRARMAELRIAEQKYRKDHGLPTGPGPRGGRGGGPGGPPR